MDQSSWLEQCQNNNFLKYKSLESIYVFFLMNPNMSILEKTELLKNDLLKIPDDELKQFLKIFLSLNHLPVPSSLFEDQVIICKVAAETLFNEFRWDAFVQVFTVLFDITPSHIREIDIQGFFGDNPPIFLTKTTITIWDVQEERNKELFAFHFNNKITICDIHLHECWQSIELHAYINRMEWSRDACLLIISSSHLMKYDIDGNEIWKTRIVPEDYPRHYPNFSNILETREGNIGVAIDWHVLWIDAQHGTIVRELDQPGQSPQYIAEQDDGILIFGSHTIRFYQRTGISTQFPQMRPFDQIAYSSHTHLMGTVDQNHFYVKRIDTTQLEIKHILSRIGTFGKIVFSQDGTLVAVSCDASILVYHIETETLWKRLVMPDNEDCVSILFSSDRSMVMATTNKNALMQWKLYGPQDSQLRALLSGINADPKDYYSDTVRQVMRRVSAKQGRS